MVEKMGNSGETGLPSRDFPKTMTMHVPTKGPSKESQGFMEIHGNI